MKKARKLLSINFLLVLLLAASFDVFAADSTVAYTADQKMESSEVTTSFPSVLPGDTVDYTVEFQNNSSLTTDWYLKNDIVTAFEDSSSASGGGYEYVLTYIDPSGAETVLYDGNLGGSNEDGSSSDVEGLKQAGSVTEDDIYLDTLSAGQKAQVRVSVTLEGESQGNAYEGTAASLNLLFSVEPIEETVTTVTTVVPGPNTGDDTNLILYIGI